MNWYATYKENLLDDSNVNRSSGAGRVDWVGHI